MLTIALALIALYALLGVAYAIPFTLRIAPRRDPVAATAPLRVRLLFIPGAIALWPFLLRSPTHLPGPSADNNQHNNAGPAQ
ncbi:MAG: hypothetical protein ACTS3F_04605 [Phycisphaerales bacterium]